MVRGMTKRRIEIFMEEGGGGGGGGRVAGKSEGSLRNLSKTF